MEEGDDCPNKCGGTMQLDAVECCSCHINAPCSACVNNPLHCDKCGCDEDGE